MANPTTQDYSEGTGLVAGNVFSEQIPLAADTYYAGMLLEFQKTGTSTVTGTGNGVASAIKAGANVKVGDWLCTFTAALVCDLTDPDGNVIAYDLTVPNGDAAVFTFGDLTFTLTDGATAWVASDVVKVTIAATGVYAALDEGEIMAIYNGPTRTLASAGYGSALTGGEIYEGALVDASNSALTMTESYRAMLRKAGFAPRKAA